MEPDEPCPCGGGTYGECCAPYHRGAEPPAAEALMRSRYAAFVLADTDYLWRTLHPDHDDRARPRDAWEAEMREGLRPLRYRRLEILDTAPPDADGVARVLFQVTLSQRRRDRSFAELSLFAHDGEGWRYLVGTTESVTRKPGDAIADWE